MHHSDSSLTRRSFLVRGLGLCAGLAGVQLLGDIPDVVADKKQKPKYSKIQIAQRAQAFADNCLELGGTPETSAKPGGVTVTCTSGNGDGTTTTCTFHSKGVRCSQAAINPGTMPDLQPQNPWTAPNDIPDVPLQPIEPTLRSGNTARRRHGRK